MQNTTERENTLLLPSTVRRLRFDAKDLHRRARRRELVRVRRGAYFETEEWWKLTARERYRALVFATAELNSVGVLSHYSAAAIWGIDIVGRWPRRVDVTETSATGGRSSAVVNRHRTVPDEPEWVWQDGLRVTTPAQTVVDLARSLPFESAVASLDSALHHTERSPALCDRREVSRILEKSVRKRGHSKAERAIAFSTDLSGSVGESRSRVRLRDLGFPEPVLQQRFRVDGVTAYTDFWWPEFSVIGEFDGHAKYLDPALLHGLTPDQAIIAEKRREDALRRVCNGFARWETADYLDADRLIRILTRAGLPRPRRP